MRTARVSTYSPDYVLLHLAALLGRPVLVRDLENDEGIPLGPICDISLCYRAKFPFSDILLVFFNRVGDNDVMCSVKFAYT